MPNTDASTRQPKPKGKGADITKLTVKFINGLKWYPRTAVEPLEEIRLSNLAALGYIIQVRAGKIMGDAELKAAVIEVIEARTASGEKKYGERLRADNGRDALLDLLQEQADAVQYGTQVIEESEGDVAA